VGREKVDDKVEIQITKEGDDVHTENDVKETTERLT
jgi:hypothetical protein